MSENDPNNNISSPAPAPSTGNNTGSRRQRPARTPSAHLASSHEPVAVPASVRVEGLAETLHDVRHELQLISHATKFNWINQRLILLRNALIALSILVVVVVTAVAAYREAYRQTLTVAAFDVPDSLAKRGITGQVVAKALFDELIKRRDLVTTLDAGELKGAWAENRADVAIPEAKFTLQAVFRYLRYMTGNEIAVDGEIIIDAMNGETVVMKVRVAGKPPTVVTGAMTDWQKLVGDLANGVLDVTQPAVLAGYLGTKVQTPADLSALSKHIMKMQSGAVKLSPQVMSVAYDAYGSALQRLGKMIEAKAAFQQAMSLDPTNGVAVINAANLRNNLREMADASVLYKQAQSMRLSDNVKVLALRNRITGATVVGDCASAATALSEAKASPLYDASALMANEAFYLARCEYEEARAVAMVAPLAMLHPDVRIPVNTLALIQLFRPEDRYRPDAIKVLRQAIANGMDDPFIYTNLALALVGSGDYEEANQMRLRGVELGTKAGLPVQNPDGFFGTMYYLKGEFEKADMFLRRFYETAPMREEQQFQIFGAVQAELKRFDEATKIFEDALAKLPKSCRLWEGFGKMYAAKGDIASALATFDKGIAAVPKCGSNYNAAARLLIKQNRLPEAKQKLDALINIAPNSDGAVIAKEILASVLKARAS